MADTLTFSVTTDYSATPLDDIGTIDFVNPAVPATATFANTQFDGVDILDNVLLDGSNGINNILVNGGSIDASLWTFNAWSPFDTITFNGGAVGDAITGSSQDDTITGGLGADTLVGGDGDDTFVYNSDDEIAAGETIAGGLGTGDTLRIAGADTYIFPAIAAPGGIERLEFATSSGVSSVLFNSNQFGGAGISDSLAITGDGNVNVIAVQTLFNASFSAAGWTFTNWSANDAVSLLGSTGAETITGSVSQANVIRGDVGADILTGGGADDRFDYASGDAVAGESVNGLGGTDTIFLIGSLVSHDLSQVSLTSIERLLFSGTATLNGGQIGSGAITVADAAGFAGVQALIVNGAAVDLSAVTFASWTAGEDTITINGTGGNDSLTGSSQFDTFNGGLGNDTYGLGADNDAVNDTGGSDTITSTVSRDLSAFATIENLTLLGAAANGTGNGLANTIVGNALANILNGAGGADTLDGGAAADTMQGGADNDTYIVDNAGDVVDESVAGSSGADVVLASVSYSLAAKALGSVENLTLLGAALTGTGNGLANVITGNGAANTLDGGDGADALLGDDGNDRLIGGLGADQFTGGTGADAFAFLSLVDSGKKKSARDTVLDFGVDDFIDLSVIDARKGGKDNKFKFIGKQDFHEKKGELHFEKKKGDVIVSGDVNGDGKADFAVLLDSVNKVAKGDFVL